MLEGLPTPGRDWARRKPPGPIGLLPYLNQSTDEKAGVSLPDWVGQLKMARYMPANCGFGNLSNWLIHASAPVP